jgi:hypothetical protein
MLALASMLVGSLGYAMQGERPWGKTVQKRVEKQQALQPKEYAIIGLWWGAVINAGILSTLLLTSRKWMPEPVAEGSQSGAVSGPSRQDEAASSSTEQKEPGDQLPLAPNSLKVRTQVVVVLTLGAVLFGAWIRHPRLAHSLWNDEEYAMRRFAHGSWEDKGNGISLFTPVSWTDTLYENRNGNNHLLNSLITRGALVTWRYYADAQRDAFSESALRMPAFILGLLTIGLVAFLGREMGAPLSGIAAAWLLAASPWHVRYSVEAKGYSMMLFFVCLALLAIVRAIRKDGLHWWVVFALSEAAFLLSFAGSLYVALAVNLIAGLALLKRKEAQRLWTLGAFNLMAAVPVLQWMLPSIPQVLAYLKSDDSLHLDLGWAWIRDFLSGCVIGFQYDNPSPALHFGTDWQNYVRGHAFGAAFLNFVVPGLFIVGLVAAIRRSFATVLIIVAPVAACMLAYAHNAASHSPMVVWYLLYVVIPLALAVPLGIELFHKKPAPLVWLAMLLLITGHTVSTWQPCMILREHDRQPIRQSVAFIRDRAPDALTAVFGVSDRQTMSYDPGVKTLSTPEDLQKLVTKSRLTGFDLYVYFCGNDESAKRNPDLMAAVRNGLKTDSAVPAEFESVAMMKGTEELFSYQIFKLKPAPPTKS